MYDGPPSLELGTGVGEFESLRDGDSIYIVQGPQAGYHFFGSVRVRNLNFGDSNDLRDPDNPTTSFAVYVENSRFDAMASTYQQGLQSYDDGAEMVGRTVILRINDDSELDGVTVKFSANVTDVDGLTVSDERTLVGLPHPNNL